MPPRKTTLAILVFLAALLVLLACTRSIALAQDSQIRVLAITNFRLPAYMEALEGFKHYLAGQGVKADFDELDLGGNGAGATHAFEKIKNQKVDVLLTLGSTAAEMAIKEKFDLPIVAGMVLDAEEIQAKPNVTGVFLDIPPEIQLQWMARILPEFRSMGVLYSQPKFQIKINAAVKIAQNMGLEISVQKVDKLTELPGALQNLSKTVKVLWGIPDEVLFNSKTAQHILLQSLENRIPLIGISAAWVKAGALYSLDWDYKDLGIQCGEIAMKVLHGTKADSIPPASPRKIRYSLNAKTAQHMKIQLSDTLIQGAQEVFR